MTGFLSCGVTTPLSCGPQAHQFDRIVPERESAREGTVFIRSSSAGSFPKRAAIRERCGSPGAGFIGDPMEPFDMCVFWRFR